MIPTGRRRRAISLQVFKTRSRDESQFEPRLGASALYCRGDGVLTCSRRPCGLSLLPDPLHLRELALPRQGARHIALGRQRVGMLGAQHPPPHLQHLALQRHRLAVLPLVQQGDRQIARSSKPLVIVLGTALHPHPPRACEPPLHLAGEGLLARFSIPTTPPSRGVAPAPSPPACGGRRARAPPLRGTRTPTALERGSRPRRDR